MQNQYKSPVLFDSAFKKSSFDFWDIIPPEDRVRLRARKTKIKDYQNDNNNSLQYWSGNDYQDRNNNNIFDEGDLHKYYITIFTSRDAKLLAGIHNAVAPLDYEIILLLENNARDRYTAPTYYVKTGKNVRRDILTKKNITTEKFRIKIPINFISFANTDYIIMCVFTVVEILE